MNDEFVRHPSVSGRTSLEQSTKNLRSEIDSDTQDEGRSSHGGRRRAGSYEVDEFELREDLRSWHLGERAAAA